jgi:Malectin domain
LRTPKRQAYTQATMRGQSLPALGSLTEERMEVEAVLRSGIFDRAPGLEKLFIYITSKFFEGSADDIKEYNIAVDAFGRGPDFDQSRDSIVRVQAHRLRERLAEYYQSEGRSDLVQIEIPNGRYTPIFRFRAQDAVVALVATPEGAIGVPALTHTKSSDLHSPEARSSLPATTAKSVDSIRILAGLMEGDYIDNIGRLWQKDQFWQGGTPFFFPNHLIFGTRDQRIYRSGREGDFSYHIPLGPGVYELRLHFAETTFGETSRAGFGGESSRIFDVLINGKPVVHFLDVVAEAGASSANIKMFKDIEPASDGALHLSFSSHSYIPFLNALEISPGTPGKMQRIRMVAQSHGYIDKSGHYWEPDHYGFGGQLVKPTDEATEVPDPGIYTGGRFGNLTYVIPVPPGRYGLRLYLSERWEVRENGTQFDILCNGVALERRFSILKNSGKLSRGIVLSFDGLEPNYQGKLALSLVPNPNYAFINALEVIDQTDDLSLTVTNS